MKLTKDTIYLCIILILIALLGQFYYAYRYQPAHQIAVYYNHDHPLNTEIINEIKDADKFVYFSVYTFTRQDIKNALLGAKYRGLKVIGLTDHDQIDEASGQKEVVKELEDADIPVYERNVEGIMHTKVLVTDKAYASGSFNWTSAATNINDEVLEVGTDPVTRNQYQSILEELFAKYRDSPAHH